MGRRLLRQLGWWLVAVTAVACSPTAQMSPSTLAATAPPLANMAASTAIAPLPTLVPAQAIATAVLAQPSESKLLEAPTPIGETAVATPTFAAYGITQTIGYSAQGRPIVSHRFGYGRNVIMLVGGIHGGYEWNTIALAYQMIAYFEENPQLIPSSVTLYIIPAANPDGQFAVAGRLGPITAVDIAADTIPGRFNGNGVDLNRNWDCNWSATAVWGGRQVSGGKRPFSEPETQALSRFIVGQQAKAVIFWHSAADGVYAGGCTTLYEPSYQLGAVYAQSAGYQINESFTSYPVTGDASDWLALQSITSFSVELETHDAIEWEKNRLGVAAMLAYYNSDE